MEGFFSDANLINLFLKLFGIVLAFIYLTYAIVLYRQTGVLLRSLETRGGQIFRTLSLIQIFVALFLIIAAFIII